jgi:hypothetical protein
MAKIQFVLVLMVVLISTGASGTTITLPVDPGIVGPPASGQFDFHFNDLNGVALSGQAFSSDWVFAGGTLARLVLQSPLFIAIIVQTNANSFPGFAGSGPTGFLLAPDGTPLDNPIDAGRAASSDGTFSVGLSLAPDVVGSLADMKGVHFDFLFPTTGFVVTGAEIRLAVTAPSTVQFGTAAQLPEPSTVALVTLGLGSLVCLKEYTRRRRARQR